MFGKVISGFMVIAMLTAQASVFAAGTQDVGNDGEKQSKKTEKIIVEGKNGPEIREITVTELTATIKRSGKRYAVVDFPQELGIDKNAPILLKQLGLLIDQAIEAEDVSSLVALSLSLATFERSANTEAKSLTSKNLLQLAGQMATFMKNKAGLLQVSKAYKESTLGLSDQAKVEEFAQLAEDTREMTDDEKILWKAFGPIQILPLPPHSPVAINNYTSSPVKVYIDNDYLGFVNKNQNRSFSTSSCDRTITIDARDLSGNRVAGPTDYYLSCKEGLSWTLR